jgi:hypothetical protein
MSDKYLYISRRCEYCHELLILIHKNKKYLNNLFKVIDIDKTPFPKFVTTVPLLNYNGQLIIGKDITKQINMYISELAPQTMPPLEHSTMPKMSTNTDIYSNKHKPPQQLEKDNMISHSNSNIQNESNSDNYSSEITNDLESYCIDGQCNIGFSSIDDSSIDNSIYETINIIDETSNSSNLHVNSDYSSLDNTYENMMNERNKDIQSNSSNDQQTIDFSLDTDSNQQSLDLRG